MVIRTPSKELPSHVKVLELYNKLDEVISNSVKEYNLTFLEIHQALSIIGYKYEFERINTLLALFMGSMQQQLLQYDNSNNSNNSNNSSSSSSSNRYLQGVYS
jgi:hypothetical protein